MPDLRKKTFKYVSSRIYSGAKIQNTATRAGGLERGQENSESHTTPLGREIKP
jgi:hypothetical protein